MNKLRQLTTRIDRCGAEIDKRNRNYFLLFATGALIISSIIFIVTLMRPFYHKFIISHGSVFLYSIILYFLASYCKKIETKHIRLIMYLSFIPLYVAGILLGTYFDPGRPAVTIIVFLCILPIFITDKPWRTILFVGAVAIAFAFCSYLFKAHSEFEADILYLPIYFSYGLGAIIFTLFDKVENAENYLLVQHRSEHDSLTEVLNRKSGELKIEELLKQQIHGTFAILDIDNFKEFNDDYGHQTGDEVLLAVSKALQQVFRNTDVVCRLGGDEFAVYALNMLDEETCERRFKALQKELSMVTLADGQVFKIEISIGCTIWLSESTDFETVYKQSDDALYVAKRQGKGCISINK